MCSTDTPYPRKTHDGDGRAGHVFLCIYLHFDINGLKGKKINKQTNGTYVYRHL